MFNPNSAQIARSHGREDSSSLAKYGPPTPPPSLPIVADKPRRFAAGRPQTGPARVETVKATGRIGSGYCVAYARAQGFEIYGNANDWPTLAKEAGYPVDQSPAVGALIVTSESSAGTNTGHVTGTIQRIKDGYSYQCEQNYVSRKVTCGWIDLSSPLVVAYIHPKTPSP